MKTGTKKTLQILTIGHSNHSFENFLSLLRESKIQVVADIRRYSSSRKFPHFNREVLCKLLDEENIRYLWLEALGGRRHTPLEICARRKTKASGVPFLTGHNAKNNKSPNVGLKSIGFRNYADYMSTGQFRTAVQKLLSVAEKLPTAIMCAEKLYWKCHRRFLSDYLYAQGIEVLHIIEAGKIVAHKLTPGVIITTDSKVIYPPPESKQTKILFDC